MSKGVYGDNGSLGFSQSLTTYDLSRMATHPWGQKMASF